jgi:hypothetical protein
VISLSDNELCGKQLIGLSLVSLLSSYGSSSSSLQKSPPPRHHACYEAVFLFGRVILFEGTDVLGDPGLDGRIILKKILKIQSVNWIHLSQNRVQRV